MYYENIETYLNEEFRRPIKWLLEGYDKKKAEEIMRIIDLLCDEHRETNACSKFYELHLDKKPSHYEYMDFMVAHFKEVDYDKLESPSTDEELEWYKNEILKLGGVKNEIKI